MVLGSHSAFACDYPEQALIPTGKSAMKEDMMAGQGSVKKYVDDMGVYLECIVVEEKQAQEAIEDLSPEIEQARNDALNKKYNAAIGAMERVATRFNAEAKSFRARDRN